MVWGVIGYTSRSPLVRIDCTLNSGRYILVVLKSVALLFIPVLQNSAIQQDNPRPSVADFVQNFYEAKNVLQLPWTAHSHDLSPTENV